VGHAYGSIFVSIDGPRALPEGTGKRVFLDLDMIKAGKLPWILHLDYGTLTSLCYSTGMA